MFRRLGTGRLTPRNRRRDTEAAGTRDDAAPGAADRPGATDPPGTATNPPSAAADPPGTTADPPTAAVVAQRTPPASRVHPSTADALDPTVAPRYFGPVPNYATSPLPVPGPGGTPVPGTGLRKFVSPLPVPGTTDPSVAPIPVAVPDTVTYPGCDYYEIGLRQYAQRLHPDLGPTLLRGYLQLNAGTDTDGRNTVTPPDRPWYLGPVIVSRRDRPVRIRFVNQLPTGVDGDLFLPVDPTAPGGSDGVRPRPRNRAVLHLHGAVTPWISAGLPEQWTTPAGETDGPPRGPAFAAVPDMPPPEPGEATLYYPNRHGARLLWYHDHTAGTAPLTVYSGQIGLFPVEDPVERELVADGVLPATQIPLVIQDRTFVPDDDQLAAQDPTWDRAAWGGRGSLWFPHVYLPNQNPYHPSGRNPVGRWDYGPWCWPPRAGTVDGPAANPYHDPVGSPDEPPVVPGTPHPSGVPAAYLDTPLVNGAAYPYLRVEPRAYRFRILNACNDRSLNLQLYRAASDRPMWHPDGSAHDPAAGEVPMVDAVPHTGLPPDWPTDGRPGGVPDPAATGPDWIRIGNEGGFLPAVAVTPSRPVDYVYDRRDVTVLNVATRALLLAPGEQADVVVDFSTAPPGSQLILYNDCPAPMPCFDPRYDHHTGGPDQRAGGGAPATLPGYGPNTRTIMQFRVEGTPSRRYDLAALRDRLPAAYAATQPPPVVPQPAYDAAFGTRTTGAHHVPAHRSEFTFTPSGRTAPVTWPVRTRSIQPVFDPDHGRSGLRLGVEPPASGAPEDGPGSSSGAPVHACVPLTHRDPPTEVLHPVDPRAAPPPDGAGAQLWRVTNHSRETRAVHFRALHVQLVNRVGRDGAVRPPDADELGWKNTVRVDPGQDVVLAVLPVLPDRLPFKVGASIRALDPLREPGSRDGFTQVDPETGGPVEVVNRRYDFGWEYAWHSGQFGAEATGAYRPLVLRVCPAPVTGLTAVPAPGSSTVLPAVRLRWTRPAGEPRATACLVQRATDAGFTTDLTDISVAPESTGYGDTTVTPGVTYHYRVRAENRIGHSIWSDTVCAAVRLAAPAGLTATVAGTAPLRAGLTWTHHSFATGTQVQRATNPTFTSGLVTTAGPVVDSHLDDTVSPNTTYYFRVRSTYRGATSPWSAVATVITPGRPDPPDGLTATVATTGLGTATVTLRWAAGTGSGGPAAGFTLQRATDADFRTAVVSFRVAGTAREFRNTGLAPGGTYHYRIQSFNAAGASAHGSSVRVRVPG